MKINHIIVLFFFLLFSCGDSPFLEDDIKEEGFIGTRSLNTKLSFENGLRINPFWAVGPEVASESKITFLLLDKDERPVTQNLDIRVKLWMPTMGHGSFPVQVTNLGHGLYQASDVFFTMPGYWDIHFQIFEEGRMKSEIKWPLDL